MRIISESNRSGTIYYHYTRIVNGKTKEGIIRKDVYKKLLEERRVNVATNESN